jgi:hypothetical protein
LNVFLLDPDNPAEFYWLDNYEQIGSINIKSGIIKNFLSCKKFNDDKLIYDIENLFYID